MIDMRTLFVNQRLTAAQDVVGDYAHHGVTATPLTAEEAARGGTISESKEESKSDSGNGSETSNYNDKLAEIVEKQAGKPYVFGDAGPNSFDCSGTVCYAIQQISLILNE